jgi:hypothetical protein
MNCTVGRLDTSLSAYLSSCHIPLFPVDNLICAAACTGPPSTVPENPPDHINKLTNMPTTRIKDLESPANETDNNSASISHTDQKAPCDFGDTSIPDYEPFTKDFTQPPNSYCPSCGYQLPLTPSSSSSSKPIPSHQPAHLPELAGRGDHSHVFSDLRSPSLARQRDKSAKEKYYGFRYVKRGGLSSEGGCCCSQSIEAEEDEKDDDNDNKDEVDAPSVDISRTKDSAIKLSQPIVTMETKQDQTTCKYTLYRLAQLPPRPPRNHHRHFDKVQGTLSHRVDERHEERKHRKAILKDGLEDFD